MKHNLATTIVLVSHASTIFSHSPAQDASSCTQFLNSQSDATLEVNGNSDSGHFIIIIICYSYGGGSSGSGGFGHGGGGGGGSCCMEVHTICIKYIHNAPCKTLVMFIDVVHDRLLSAFIATVISMIIIKFQ
jgi:hypothetical protein